MNIKLLRVLTSSLILITLSNASFSATNRNIGQVRLKARPLVEGISIRATATPIWYSAGDPVYIDVYITNERQASLTLPEPHVAEQMLTITVERSDGKLAQLTAYGLENYLKPNYAKHLTMQQYIGSTDMGSDLNLAPQNALHFKILLSRLYDLTNEGWYSVIASQWVPKQDGSGYTTIVSDSLSIQIGDQKNGALTPETTNPTEPGITASDNPIGQHF